MTTTNRWSAHAHPERQAISIADLRCTLSVGKQLQLVLGLRAKAGQTETLPAKVLTVTRVQTHEFACYDDARADEIPVWLPFARSGKHTNQVAWYRIPDGLELETPVALMRYQFSPPIQTTPSSEPSIKGAPTMTTTNQQIPNFKSILERASTDALSCLLDASYDEVVGSIGLESSDEPALDAELSTLLTECGAQQDDDGDWVFGDPEHLSSLMALVQQLAPDEDASSLAVGSNGAGEGEDDEDIVFNDIALTQPESLPDEASESLSLEGKGYQLRRIPVNEIRIEPANNPRSRTALAGVIRLARNIAKRGLLQPVTVRPINAIAKDAGEEMPDLPMHELVFGYRRLLAIRHAIRLGLLKLDYTVPCIVRKLNDSQVRLAALSENEEREEVDPLDQAEGWARLRLTQTEAGIADAAGVSLTNVKRCLKVAFGVCDEVKTKYRQQEIGWSALIAFSYGALEVQRAYLETTANATWRLSADQVRQAMTALEFKLANARFTLAEYEAAGGLFETDLWQSDEGTRLLSRPVIERLQTEWAQRQLKALQARGASFAVLRSGAWNWWSEFNRAAPDAEGIGAVVHVRPDWTVDVLEGLVPLVAQTPGTGNGLPGTSGNPPSMTGIASGNGPSSLGTTQGASATSEVAKSEHSEAGITLVRRLRTAALQQAILSNTDPKLPLALAVLGFLGEREIRFGVNSLGETDAITSVVILAELEAFTARVPNTGFNPVHGLEFSFGARQDPNRSLETLNALLNFPQLDLERLHRLLVATMVGDFSAAGPAHGHGAYDGNFQDRKCSLKVNGLISGLAAHLKVKGNEVFEVSEEFLKTISFRKIRLRPYIAAALGENLASALMDNPKAKIIAEIVTHKAKIPAEFVPPELDFALHAKAGTMALAVESMDDFDDDDEATQPGMLEIEGSVNVQNGAGIVIPLEDIGQAESVESAAD
jgi:ParB/RepB/Spo0J family partition protein